MTNKTIANLRLQAQVYSLHMADLCDMKATKDIHVQNQNWYPAPATTTEQINLFRQTPFFIRFAHKIPARDTRAAYKVGQITCPDRVIAIHFGSEARFLDIEHPGNPAFNVLRCVNELLYPHYEIRKYRGIRNYGQSAVDAFFEPLSTDTELPTIEPRGDYY